MAQLQETGADRRSRDSLAAQGATEFRQTIRGLQKDANRALDEAMTANRDFIAETNPVKKRGLADVILSQLKRMAEYNNNLKSIGGSPIKPEMAAFRNLDGWVADETNNYTSPYPSKKPVASGDGVKIVSATRIP